MKLPELTLDIQGRKIGNNFETYFIADIAANHDGDLGRAKELIYLAAEAGADAAKFQHFQAETIVSDKGFKDMGGQQSHQSKWKKTVSEVYRDASVSLNWTEELKDTCDKVGIPFFTTPYLRAFIETSSEIKMPLNPISFRMISFINVLECVALFILSILL